MEENVIQIGEQSVFVEDYFQQRINTDFNSLLVLVC